MINVTDPTNVVINYESKSYNIADNDSYKELLILLTNPNPDVQFADTLYEVDDSITDPEFQAIATRYSDFFKSFIETRVSKLEEINDELIAGQDAVTAALNMLDNNIPLNGHNDD